MENNKNHPADDSGQIDDLFRKNLEGHRVEPGKSLWRGINRKLLLNEMIHFNFSNFPGTYWIAGIAGIVMIPLILYLTLSPGKIISPVSGTAPQTAQNLPLTGTSKSATVRGNTSVADPPVVSLHKKTPVTNPPADPSFNGKISKVINQASSKPIQNEKKFLEINQSHTSAPLTPEKGTIKKTRSQTSNPPVAIANASRVNTPRSIVKPKHKVGDNDNSTLNDLLSSDESRGQDEVLNPSQQPVSDVSIIRMTSLTSIDSLYRKKIKYPSPDFVNLGIYPASTKDHVVIPQYFSLGLEFMPEMTFYKTPATYSKVDYWFGADLSYHLGKFYLRPGVRIGYVYDNGAYQVNFKRNDSIGFYRKVVSYYIDPQHPGVIIYNTVNHTVYDSLIHRSTDQSSNRYQYIQVPLILGFDVIRLKNFRFSIQAGPVVSFFLADKETSSQNTDLTNARLLSRVQSTPPGKNPNWQIWGAIHVDYKIDENFDCYLEPTYKYYFSPMVENEAVPVQAPWSIGVGFGVRYNFGFNTQNP